MIYWTQNDIIIDCGNTLKVWMWVSVYTQDVRNWRNWQAGPQSPWWQLIHFNEVAHPSLYRKSFVLLHEWVNRAWNVVSLSIMPLQRTWSLANQTHQDTANKRAETQPRAHTTSILPVRCPISYANMLLARGWCVWIKEVPLETSPTRKRFLF